VQPVPAGPAVPLPEVDGSPDQVPAEPTLPVVSVEPEPGVLALPDDAAPPDVDPLLDDPPPLPPLWGTTVGVVPGPPIGPLS
jgi:hypothetical protein